MISIFARYSILLTYSLYYFFSAAFLYFPGRTCYTVFVTFDAHGATQVKTLAYVYVLLLVLLVFHLAWLLLLIEGLEPKNLTIQMTAVLFVFLYSMVLTFVSVYETLKCDHSNESY